MTYDPALTAIAVATNDALVEHLWRHDIGAVDSHDPVAHLGAALHQQTLEFNDTAGQLTGLLDHAAHAHQWAAASVRDFATLDTTAVDSGARQLVRHLGRFDAQRHALLSLYQVWRRHRHISRDPRVRYLWVQPYDPRHGMVTLTTDETGMAWFVQPDTIAAEHHLLHLDLGAVVGDIWQGSAGWQATAYRHPDHRTTRPEQVYRLAPADSEPAACRALLRWWALLDTDDGAGLTPDRLTPEQQADLTA